MGRWIGLVLLCATACAPRVDLTVQAPATWFLEQGGNEMGVVTRAVDGDTIEVEIQEVSTAVPGAAPPGEVVDVRLLGIDTPESVDPRRPVECFGNEAARATATLLEGQSVRLVRDVEDVDSFGRLLRYVYIGDEMANARLVVNGYANVFTYPPNVRWSDLFVQLEREARDQMRGLWSPDSCDGQS